VNLQVCQKLRNYRSKERPTPATLIQAIRATWATPTLFTPIHLELDGGKLEYVASNYGFNNPTRELIKEAIEQFGPASRVACIISIGCGVPSPLRLPSPVDSTALLELAERVATDCQRTADELETLMGDTGMYFRYSDNQQNDMLFDPEKIDASAETYLRQPKTISLIDDGVRSAEGIGSGTLEQICA
jgi:hypothetical protein